MVLDEEDKNYIEFVLGNGDVDSTIQIEKLGSFVSYEGIKSMTARDIRNCSIFVYGYSVKFTEPFIDPLLNREVMSQFWYDRDWGHFFSDIPAIDLVYSLLVVARHFDDGKIDPNFVRAERL